MAPDHAVCSSAVRRDAPHRRGKGGEEMSIFPRRIRLATDGSREALLPRPTAIDMAESTNSELHLVTVAPGYPSYDVRNPSVAEQLREQAEDILNEQAAKIEQEGGTVAEKHLRIAERYRAQQIVKVAEDIGAGLIVIGSRGLGGVRRALMGSVSDSGVRHAHCPVLVVRDGEHESDYVPGRILLAVDGSAEAAAAARTAVELADRTDSELHVVHVGEVRPVSHPERRGYRARYDELQE